MGLFKPSSNSSNEITPIMYGAIADGSSHPVSEKFDSLEAVQVVYPSATSLDDEIDLLAFEKAIQNHDKVKIPSGRYIFNRTVQIQDGNIIEGDGYSSWIQYKGAENTFLFMINTSATLKNLKLSYYTIDNRNGILINNNIETNIEDIMFEKFEQGIVLYNSKIINITKCCFHSMGTSISSNYSSCLNIEKCHFEDNSTSIYVDNSTCNILKNTFINSTKTINIFASITNIENCFFETNNQQLRYYSNIVISTNELNNIIGCHFYDYTGGAVPSFIEINETYIGDSKVNIYNNKFGSGTSVKNESNNTVTVNSLNNSYENTDT